MCYISVSSLIRYSFIYNVSSVVSYHMVVCMYEKVTTVMVSIEETVSLSQGERGPDRDSYFPNPVS